MVLILYLTLFNLRNIASSNYQHFNQYYTYNPPQNTVTEPFQALSTCDTDQSIHSYYSHISESSLEVNQINYLPITEYNSLDQQECNFYSNNIMDSTIDPQNDWDDFSNINPLPIESSYNHQLTNIHSLTNEPPYLHGQQDLCSNNQNIYQYNEFETTMTHNQQYTMFTDNFMESEQNPSNSPNISQQSLEHDQKPGIYYQITDNIEHPSVFSSPLSLNIQDLNESKEENDSESSNSYPSFKKPISIKKKYKTNFMIKKTDITFHFFDTIKNKKKKKDKKRTICNKDISIPSNAILEIKSQRRKKTSKQNNTRPEAHVPMDTKSPISNCLKKRKNDDIQVDCSYTEPHNKYCNDDYQIVRDKQNKTITYENEESTLNCVEPKSIDSTKKNKQISYILIIIWYLQKRLV
ncbi:hypothetical protein SLOPH_972 [Spraguea lophii 42_110]|uniref:Uncharacterized protein n=1 Tax=Spraguea lophii (strain 42_110) TaxID=1358809 RepID=S7W7W8_SPRLO|nr:hypothetical protein SLOPH_972 [Spraguea lophii 42_110]